MDILEKFLRKVSYKFPKGYPDINDTQDVLLLETLLDQLILFEFEDKGPIPDDIEQIRSAINNHPEYKDKVEAVQSKDKSGTAYWIYIKGVSQFNREGRIAVIKDLQDKGLLPKGNINDKESPYLNTGDYKIYIKGSGKNPFDTDPDQKEGLVVFMYNILNSEIDLKPFNEETIQSNVEILNATINEKSLYKGLDKTVADKVKSYINKVITFDFTTINKPLLGKLNMYFSSANEIYKVYKGKNLTREGIFDEIRAMGSKLCQVPPDKWNPGDIYVVLNDIDSVPNDLGKLNALFENNWGKNSNSNYVSISLKEEKSQPGRAKSYLDNLVRIEGLKGKPFNLSKEELEWDTETLKQKVRAQQEAFIKKVEGKGIDLEGNWNDLPQNDKQLQTKYGSYKLLEFLFANSKTNDPRKDILALASYGMGLSGINPTFFKVTGIASGESAKVTLFLAGSTTTFIDNPKFTNSPNAGGLDLDTNIAVLKGSEITDRKKESRKFRTAGSAQVAIV